MRNLTPTCTKRCLKLRDENVDPGTIVQEIQPGYMYNERLLRPSFVGVAKKKTETKKKVKKKMNSLVQQK